MKNQQKRDSKYYDIMNNQEILQLHFCVKKETILLHANTYTQF